MNPNQALWEKGDFTRIAASMRDSGQALVNTLGVKAGCKSARGSDADRHANALIFQ